MVCLPKDRKGKIFIMGNWQIPIIHTEQVDLFWNAASFQEMEPDVVLNYLAYVNRQAQAVFLQELMEGTHVASNQGMSARRAMSPGVLETTKLEHYKEGLADFTLMDVTPSLLPTGTQQGNYSNSFWKRN